MSSHEDVKSKSINEELTMRRARLRGSLAKRALPPDPYAVVPDNQEVQPITQRSKSSKAQKSSGNTAISQEQENAPEQAYTVATDLDSNEPQSVQLTSPAEDLVTSDSEAKSTATSMKDMVDKETAIPADKGSSIGSHSSFNAPHVEHELVVEHLASIDQTLSACATNLSALQKVTDEQFESLKNLSEMLQHQVFSELSLSLTSTMESLSQALEPMKAVAEIVPAIDQLVSLMESKEKKAIEFSPETRLTPDQLIVRLADKLSSGYIDPSTFKAACMAVYPADQPADLLHRLVELLGTERLAGELFRAAYDAVQAPETASSIAGGAATKFSAIAGNNRVEELVAELESLRQINERLKKQNEQNDEHLLEELEVLRKANDEYKGQLRTGSLAAEDRESEGSQKTVEELQEKLRQYEEEFSGALAQRDDELQEARELLNSRWEEFNTRYDELTETLHRRDELLRERESELQRKDSEISQLKAQMEELQEQTKDMIMSLQKQLGSNVPKEDTSKSVIQQGFFDVAPSTAQAPSLFDHAPARPLFEQESPARNVSPVSQPDVIGQESRAPSAAQSQGGSFPQDTHSLNQPQATSKQERVTQPAPFASGAGSYGSGVRAQVFEVIVRQALAGAPWREICAGPMQVNNITPEEVEAEVKHRQAILGKT